MLKRIIPVVMVLVLFVAMLPMQASAAETEGNYLNLLDYCAPSEDGSSFTVNGKKYIDFQFPNFLGRLSIYGFELTLSYSGSVAPSILDMSLSVIGTSNSTKKITPIVREAAPGILRVRGGFQGHLGDRILITFNSSVSTNVNLLSFNLYLSDVADIPLSCTLVGTEEYPYYVDVEACSSKILYFPSSSGIKNKSIEIKVDDWRNFDCISVAGSIMCHTVNSIEVYLHDNTNFTKLPIAFDINLIDGGAGSLNPVRSFNIIADLSSLNHSSQPDSTLCFIFDLSYSNSSADNSYFSFESCYGSIFLGAVDSEARLNSFMLGVLNGIYETFTGFAEFWLVVQDEYTIPYYFSVSTGLEHILTELQKISEGVPVDDKVTEDMTSSSDKLGDMTAQMQQGTPNVSVDDVNVNMSNLVSAGGMTAATSLAATITSDPLVSSMLMIVISLALVGFVFFGKR